MCECAWVGALTVVAAWRCVQVGALSSFHGGGLQGVAGTSSGTHAGELAKGRATRPGVSLRPLAVPTSSLAPEAARRALLSSLPRSLAQQRVATRTAPRLRQTFTRPGVCVRAPVAARSSFSRRSPACRPSRRRADPGAPGGGSPRTPVSVAGGTDHKKPAGACAGGQKKKKKRGTARPGVCVRP